ncbi:hypothetical protein BDB01DRAFT_722629 [Pilobolus umbonatus]|nr:hypothetical protein BDB01DRAFT_722629 [Pilobolus umbonatus]
MSSSALFSPIKVGLHQLKHRVVLAPLTRFRASADGIPTPLMEEYYSQRTSEGGLMISEATLIGKKVGGNPHLPGIYNKDQVDEWQKIAKRVHEKGGKIMMQLWHPGRAGSTALLSSNESLVSASDIPISGKNLIGEDYDVPRALKTEEIADVIKEFGEASMRAMEAGFDGVEVHGGYGYLIDQFINNSSNNRQDEYGGSIENRCRLALEIIDRVSQSIGEEKTAIRLTPESGYQDMRDDTPVETWGHITRSIQTNRPNLAYLHFVGSGDNSQSLQPYRQLWKGPFMSAGGYSTAVEHAIEVADKHNDLVSFGRAFIANPDLPKRVQHGWKFNKYDRSTFYSGGANGYTDYPFHPF